MRLMSFPDEMLPTCSSGNTGVITDQSAIQEEMSAATPRLTRASSGSSKSVGKPVGKPVESTLVNQALVLNVCRVVISMAVAL